MQSSTGHVVRVHVRELIEKTNGLETAMPIYWIGQDGYRHVWPGYFWFEPDG